ncbi:NAD(P)H-dependent glycerol-3-phosphate dehydrogenase [Ornithinicoccus halotolerans]|uniref:NAD(P)H-dependent glycerol-3-phosphate dehydrogenase n=1 Tax=Ornithinicoccus halotolerans TaxID=1748220 RepID=UPI0012959DDD|nr:NAD(P)H-dependent glycerol-3-phosphate dehydrogenase [Ornithinicoccus halotolerans]
MRRVAVLGSGSWGTAFAGVLADAGGDQVQVVVHGRRPALAQAINRDHVNAEYLPGRVLPGSVRATTDAEDALTGADLVVLAVPSQTLRDNLTGWAPLLPAHGPVVSLMKGIENGTGLRMSEVVTQVGGVDPERVAVLSGPNLAREIADRQPAASVIASASHDTADVVAAAVATPYFRPYTETDVVGTELGGAMKNVVALAVGLAEGLGYGDNTKASIITRGLAETARLGAALGADPATLMGLAGVGDLIATCMSPLSRNHRFGVSLGRGMTPEEALVATGQTAEGVRTCRSVVELAGRHGVDVPISAGITAVLEEGVDPRELADALMSRARKHERQ